MRRVRSQRELEQVQPGDLVFVPDGPERPALFQAVLERGGWMMGHRPGAARPLARAGGQQPLFSPSVDGG